MAINFPNSPSLNDTFTVSGITFTWNGSVWNSNVGTEISTDTTPHLGGDLNGGGNDLHNIGIVTATSFSGSLVGDVVGKNAAGAIAQTFTTMGVYGERIVDYPMVFRVIAGLALMSLILLPVINFNYLKELKASNTNPKMTPVPDGFTKNDLQFIGRVRTGLLLLIPTLVWFLLVFIDSLMQRTLLAEHLVYWINIAAIICSLVGLGFLVQALVPLEVH